MDLAGLKCLLQGFAGTRNAGALRQSGVLTPYAFEIPACHYSLGAIPAMLSWASVIPPGQYDGWLAVKDDIIDTLRAKHRQHRQAIKEEQTIKEEPGIEVKREINEKPISTNPLLKSFSVHCRMQLWSS